MALAASSSRVMPSLLDYLLRSCELGVLGRVVDVAAGGAGAGVSVLPQAARAKTMTRASSRESMRFIFIFPPSLF